MPDFRPLLKSLYLSFIGLVIHIVRYFFFILAIVFTIGLFSARWLGHEYSLVEVFVPFYLYLGYSALVMLHKVAAGLTVLQSWFLIVFGGAEESEDDGSLGNE
jgi:hypothetical protein